MPLTGTTCLSLQPVKSHD